MTFRWAAAGLALAISMLQAGPTGPETMAFIQLAKRGDSVVVADIMLVPGRARLPRFPELIDPDRKWLCEIRDAAGAVVWNHALPDPFGKPRHSIVDADDSPDSLAVVRVPFRAGYLKASFHRLHPRNPLAKTAGAEAAAQEVSTEPILTLTFPRPAPQPRKEGR